MAEREPPPPNYFILFGFGAFFPSTISLQRRAVKDVNVMIRHVYSPSAEAKYVKMVWRRLMAEREAVQGYDPPFHRIIYALLGISSCLRHSVRIRH